MKQKKLIIVESPTKARTIRKFLPEQYKVEASMGHIRDLPATASEIPAAYRDQPWARLGVNVDKDFEPLYVIPSDKKKVVKQLKEALKEAGELYIATDEDREGESIGWHLIEVLRPRMPVYRMVFHEITREAIRRALESPREINRELVEAQETRRILDRLVGYTVSPVLWRKIAPKLSAGRVQSVAVRLLVLREKERIAFVPATYWGIEALLARDTLRFKAVLTHLGGKRIATGKDFDETTGKLKVGADVLLLDESRAKTLVETLPETTWVVDSVASRIVEKKPAPPFITSTLQQEANRKLGFSAAETMRIAQRLYEQGYITYMRTDSPHLAEEALEGIRAAIVRRFGGEYVAASPRQYASRTKGAQEAHEAIRPAGTEMKTAEELGLSGKEARLYDLIWRRTMASQMAPARLKFTTVHICAGEGEEEARFRATSREVLFPGFLQVYVEGSDEEEEGVERVPLSQLEEGEEVTPEELRAVGHETRPPARYTEATLVKTLEQEGIGRPSTYASIIDTIVRRGYARREKRQLIPTFTAFAANQVLERQFEQLVDTHFTATMEQVLDEIAEGRRASRPYLNQFYRGEEGLEKKVAEAFEVLDAREVSTIRMPQWEPYVIRVGKFGPYVEGPWEGEIRRASLPADVAPASVTREWLETLLREKQEQPEIAPLGTHPETGAPIYVKKGPYGWYVQAGEDDARPQRVSLPASLPPEEVDLEKAQYLLSLPRELGTHPETGKPVLLQVGRYGPYVQHERERASLPEVEKLFTLTLEEALTLLTAKKKPREPLRTLGTHPETGEPVEVWEGRYGPYVRSGKINASLPRGMEPGTVTLEQAVELLARKAAAPARVRRKRTSKKKT